MSYGQGGPQFYAPQPQHPIQPMHVASPPIDAQSTVGYGQSPYSQQGAYNAFQSSQGYNQPNQQRGGFQQQQQGFPGQEYWNAPAAQMGLQVGQSAMLASQEYVNANVSKYVNISSIRRYFNVTNSYVVRKLLLLLWPWTHKPWAREVSRDGNGNIDGFQTPRDDINSPDMYIPIMAFVTYILQNSLIAGIRGAFQADLLGQTAGWALAFLLTENLIIKFGCYLLNIPSTFFLDFVAYSGYKYIGIIITNLMGLLFKSSWVYWITYFYTGAACFFFVLRSLRSAILQEKTTEYGPTPTSNKPRKVYFLFLVSLAQFVWMWLMLR